MVFLHEIAVTFGPGHDSRALGGAVTQALCGDWDHEGPCRWPHRTETVPRAGDAIVARVVFSCAEEDEAQVRGRIVEAAKRGWLEGPDGRAEWTVDHQAPGSPNEKDMASPPANTEA